MSTDLTTSLEKFVAATDRKRWWTTPELTVALVSSGLWAAAGLGNPDQQQIVAKNGPRFYLVEVDGQDWTARIDAVLGALGLDINSDKINMNSLVRLAVGSDREAPFYIYKQLGYLVKREIEHAGAQHEIRGAFEEQHMDELETTFGLMEAMGADLAGEVLPDTGRVQFMVELLPDG
jgi:hypothetical protein